MGIEIEAKFAVPDRGAFVRLRALQRLGGFALLRPRTIDVHDDYLDTGDRAMLTAGYACRRRRQGDAVVMTLKSVLAPPDVVHRREELEVTLPPSAPPDLPPRGWPPSEARERAVQLTRGAVIGPLFGLEQTRFVRDVVANGRHAALFSLDEVRLLLSKGGQEQWWELELELGAEGTEADLAALAGWVRDSLQLDPSPISKFERALRSARPDFAAS